MVPNRPNRPILKTSKRKHGVGGNGGQLGSRLGLGVGVGLKLRLEVAVGLGPRNVLTGRYLKKKHASAMGLGLGFILRARVGLAVRVQRACLALSLGFRIAVTDRHRKTKARPRHGGQRGWKVGGRGGAGWGWSKSRGWSFGLGLRVGRATGTLLRPNRPDRSILKQKRREWQWAGEGIA